MQIKYVYIYVYITDLIRFNPILIRNPILDSKTGFKNPKFGFYAKLASATQIKCCILAEIQLLTGSTLL